MAVCKGISDLVFYHLRGLARVFGKNDDLNVGEIRDGIQWYPQHGVNSGRHDKQSHQDNQEFVFYG